MFLSNATTHSFDVMQSQMVLHPAEIMRFFSLGFNGNEFENKQKFFYLEYQWKCRSMHHVLKINYRFTLDPHIRYIE